MARVTVEDCLEKVDSRFSLVLIAAERARRLERGVNETSLPRENDKNTVIALREIAEGLVDETIFQQKFEEILDESAVLMSPEAALTVPPAAPASVIAVAPVEDAPAEDAPAEDAPAEDAPAEDAPAEDAPVEDAPAEDTSSEDSSSSST